MHYTLFFGESAGVREHAGKCCGFIASESLTEGFKTKFSRFPQRSNERDAQDTSWVNTLRSSS